MNSADIAELDRCLSRLHRMCGRRAPAEAEVKFWFDELAEFPAADVFDTLRRWERESEGDHPPTLKIIKRMVSVKVEAHRRARELRIVAPWSAPGPNALAFARMWRAVREGAARDLRAWCEAVVADSDSGHDDMQFARAVLARLGPAPKRTRARAPAPFVGPADQLVRAETEAEREARLEREAIIAESAGT